MQDNLSLGSLSTFSTEVHVLRDGAENILFQGEPLMEGDVIVNHGSEPVEFTLPARSTGQGMTTMTVAPGATAQLTSSFNTEGMPVTEVTSNNPADITLAVEDGAFPVAEVVQGEVAGVGMAGLFGAGLLEGSGSALGAGAAAIGGGFLLAAGGGGSGDDDLTTSPNTSMSPQPNNSQGVTPAEDTNGLQGAVAEVDQAVQGTPLEPAGAALSPVQTALKQISDALEPVAAADPTGLAGALQGLVGGAAANPSADNASGLVGIVGELLNGLAEGSEGTPVGGVTSALNDGLSTPLALADGFLGLQGDALAPVQAADPTGLSTLASNLIGGSNGEGSLLGGSAGVEPADNTSGVQGALGDVGGALAAGPLNPVNTVIEPVQELTGVLANQASTFTALDPTGVTGIVPGILGGTGGADLSAEGGAVGAVTEVLEGVANSTAGTPAGIIADPVVGGLSTGLDALGTVTDTVAGALDPVASADPTGLVGTVQQVLGSEPTADAGTTGGLPGLEIFDGLLASGGGIPVLGGLLSGGALAGATDGGLPLVGDLPVLGDVLGGGALAGATDGGLPLVGDLPVLGDVLSGGALAGVTDGGLPLVGDLPLIGDLTNVIAASAGDTGSLLDPTALTGGLLG